MAEIKTCYMLDLAQENYEWTESAPMIAGRFKFQMVTSGSKIYAVGGEGTFTAHDNIEVNFVFVNCHTKRICLCFQG